MDPSVVLALAMPAMERVDSAAIATHSESFFIASTLVIQPGLSHRPFSVRADLELDHPPVANPESRASGDLAHREPAGLRVAPEEVEDDDLIARIEVFGRLRCEVVEGMEPLSPGATHLFAPVHLSPVGWPEDDLRIGPVGVAVVAAAPALADPANQLHVLLGHAGGSIAPGAVTPCYSGLPGYWICCTDQPFPSGSLKKTKRPQGKSCTSLTSTPRAASSSWAVFASSTTS